MQRLTLTIPVGDKSPGDSFRVFANVDQAGRATEAIDFSRPISGEAAQPFWPLAASKGWGIESWGKGPWGGVPSAVPADRQVRTPRLYHGTYRFAVVSYDLAGNASAGTPAELSVVVNSGPMPTTRFRQVDVEDGRPVFAFDPPPQFRED